MLAAIVMSACASRLPASARATSTPRFEPGGADDVAWPAALLFADGEGPAVFRRAEDGATGYAWVSGGVALRPAGAPREGRVRAVVDGALRLRGWVSMDRLEAIVLTRGRLGGTPVYLTPGDHVRLRGARGEMADVEAHPRLGVDGLERPPPFVGELAMSHLGATLAGIGEGPTPGRAVAMRTGAVLRERPDGAVVYTLPQHEPPLLVTVLRERGDWVGVRIGIGPYLVGWLPRRTLAIASGAPKQSREVLDPWRGRRPPPRADSEVLDPFRRRTDVEPPPSIAPDGLPSTLRSAVVRPVWRVRAGTRVRVEGATVAVFTEPGWAVELERQADGVLILGAIDDDARVRGTVPADALEATE